MIKLMHKNEVLARIAKIRKDSIVTGFWMNKNNKKAIPNIFLVCGTCQNLKAFFKKDFTKYL